MIALYAQLVALFVAVLVVGCGLLVLPALVTHWRVSRRTRKRIGWYS